MLPDSLPRRKSGWTKKKRGKIVARLVKLPENSSDDLNCSWKMRRILTMMRVT
jgi:hypothetical protein